MSTVAVARRRMSNFNPWLLVGLVVLLLAIGLGVILTRRNTPSTTTTPSTVPVTRGNITATVAGSGSVDAAQVLDLPFASSGTVAEVLVKQGDNVVAGQALAQLNSQLLQVQVANAQASLASAQAKLVQAQSGNATPEDTAAGQAAVAQAQANYNKLLQGPNPAQLASAQASVTSAQSAYDAAVQTAGANNAQLSAALDSLQKAQEALNVAQQNYNSVAWRTDVSGTPQSQALQNATIAYQQALASYNALIATNDTSAKSKVSTAAAQLASAKASLYSLQHPATAADLAAAQANIDLAKANLAKLNAPATEHDVTIAQAAVVQAQQSLALAQLNLDNATLRAPFAGTITAVNVVPGGQASASTAAVELVDRSTLHVDLTLSENDAVRVQAGQPVSITINSLSQSGLAGAGAPINGTVTFVSPAATNTNGVVTYAVRVSFPNNRQDVRVGMTANLIITTARKQSVLLVPNTALLPKGNGHAVELVNASGDQNEVDVQTGLTDGTNTEIVSGLQAGQNVVALPSIPGASSTPAAAPAGPGG